MKHLTASRDGARLFLSIDPIPALKAAAAAIRGARFEGTVERLAVYSYPALPDSWRDIRIAITPTIDPAAEGVVSRLEERDQAVERAVAAKGSGSPLTFDPLLRSTPMAHQRDALNFSWALLDAGEAGGAELMEQGTGKTLVAIGLANALHARGTARWVLVLVPNSLKGTWGAEDGEILKHSLAPPTIVVLRGSRAARAERLRAALAELPPAEMTGPLTSVPLLWVVANYEEFAEDPRRSTHLDDVVGAIRGAPPGILVCDESTAVKNPRAKRTRSVHELARHFRHRIIMTGTPITKSPLDSWSQYEVVDRGALGFPTFIGFERTYAVTQRRQGPHGTFHEVVGYRNLDDLERRIARISYRVRAQDCLDLPPVVVQRIPVELSAEQEKLLTRLRDDMVALVDGGGVLDGRNILTRYLRMAEVLGGFPHLVDERGQPAGVRALDPNPKLDAAVAFVDLAREAGHKVVIFANFRAEIEALTARLAHHGALPFYGGVGEADREVNRRRFDRDPEAGVLVCQYQTGAKGLNLTVADTLLFYSLTFNLEDFLQARKRIHRIGQTAERVTEAYLVASSRGRGGRARQTLDQIQLTALDQKKQLADLVTGDALRATIELMS